MKKRQKRTKILAVLCALCMLFTAMLSACSSSGTSETATEGYGAGKTGTDAPGADTSGTDISGADTAGADALGTDAADTNKTGEAAGADTSGTDTSGSDSAGKDTLGATGQEPGVAPPDFKWPEDFSLYEAYKDDFLIGTIYTDASRSGKDKELILKHFNVITPENIMKPQYMQPSEGKFNYRDTDEMVQFAEENGLKLVGHTLAWHSQSGNWLGINVDRETAIKQLKSHIMNIVGQYKGSFLSWDVVNEAINDGVSLPKNGDWTKCLRQTQWLKSIGPDYLELAFTFAREADPDLKLYYNDYNLNNKNKADIVYAMVKDFKERNIPIDGIGMQGHYSAGMSVGTVEYSLKKFSELGVAVSITELDVTVDGAPGTGLTDELELKQAITYAELFKLFRRYKDTIERVTFWGYVDNKSWRRDRFPCLFNADYSPKQAAYAVLDPDMFLLMKKGSGNEPPVNTAKAKAGTPVIDGEIDEVWKYSPEFPVDKPVMAWEGATGKVRLLWDKEYIYVLFEVKDGLLNSTSPNAYEQDSVEIFLDQNHDKSSYYESDDGQYRVNYKGVSTFGYVPDKPGFLMAAKETDGGYLVEMAIPLVVTSREGMTMGFDAQVNDSNGYGMRQSIMKFNDKTDFSYLTTENFGILELIK